MIFSRHADKTVAIFTVMLLTGCAALQKPNASSTNSTVETSSTETITRTIARTKILYAAQNIAKGEVISRKSIEEREIWKSKLPPDAITESSFALGRVAKYDVAAGELISIHDLGESKDSGDNKKSAVKIILSQEEQEKLAKKAEESHQSASDLVKSWVLEHLKK